MGTHEIKVAKNLSNTYSQKLLLNKAKNSTTDTVKIAPKFKK